MDIGLAKYVFYQMYTISALHFSSRWFDFTVLWKVLSSFFIVSPTFCNSLTSLCLVGGTGRATNFKT